MTWGWALLLKPFIGIAFLAVVFGLPMLLVKLLRPLFPEGWLKDVLFRERGGQRPSRPADAGHRVLDDVALIGRETRDD